MTTRLSIIIPALNEAAVLPDTLQAPQPLRAHGVEVILADGGKRGWHGCARCFLG